MHQQIPAPLTYCKTSVFLVFTIASVALKKQGANNRCSGKHNVLFKGHGCWMGKWKLHWANWHRSLRCTLSWVSARAQNVLLHCHVSSYPLPIHNPSLFSPSPPLPLPQTPSSLLFSAVLPSLSIPQVRHTEPHCVSGLGRERTVQPLTMCCHWTHLRRPQKLYSLHAHTHCLFLSPFPPSFHHSPPSAVLSFHPSFTFLPLTLPLLLEAGHHQQALPSFSKTNVYNQTDPLKKSIDETLRFQSKRASRTSAGGGVRGCNLRCQQNA